MPKEPRLETPAPLAAVVDLGANAARLALATLDDAGQLESRGRWREFIRLGEGVRETGRLSESAMRRGLACFSRFSAIIRAHRVQLADAVATSALRDARNAGAFIARAARLGVALRVIPAKEEARLALAGVFVNVGALPERALVFDVGGGSLEVMLAAGERIWKMVSLPAGVVYLTERYLAGMPTADERVRACAEEVDAMLSKVDFGGAERKALPFIGCGGVVALAWFLTEGAPLGGSVSGISLSASLFEEWVDRFARMQYGQRRELRGFEPGREDVVLAGLIVVRALLRWGRKEEFSVSTGGLREGRLLELLRTPARRV